MRRDLLSERFRALAMVGAHLVVPLGIVLIPTAWLEATPPLCLSRLILRRRCPGCGMTRAVSAVCHLDAGRAWRHNPLVVIVLPLLAWAWLQSLTQASARAALHLGWRHPA
ncbi:MAG: DUF2752 domain-containing protein [Ktedonobacterales bacterium]